METAIEQGEEVTIIGELELVLFDPATGRREVKVYRNKVTNYLRSTLAKWLTGTPNYSTVSGALLPPDRIALGTGTTTPQATDTAQPSTRKGYNYRQVFQSYYAQITVVYTTSDPTGQFNESGLFDAAGNLWCRVLIDINKQAGQSLTATWKILVKGN